MLSHVYSNIPQIQLLCVFRHPTISVKTNLDCGRFPHVYYSNTLHFKLSLFGQKYILMITHNIQDDKQINISAISVKQIWITGVFPMFITLKLYILNCLYLDNNIIINDHTQHSRS